MRSSYSMPTWPDHIVLRDWQTDALLEWQTDRPFRRGKPQDFLAVATPGAGKTRFALRLAHQLFEARIIQLLFIVCPTAHLRRQWADKSHEVGMQIDPKWENTDGTISTDYRGVAITYQFLASGANSHIIRRLCSRQDTLVIFDEIHHAGDEKPWGNRLREAFEPARYRLLLTGTAFRSDNHTIPYVRYDQNYSVSDFTYSYSDALRDGVCRPVFFPSYEGNMEWLSRKGQHVSATFADKLSEEQAAERLKTALDPNGNWLKKVITEAHERLMEIRDGEHRDAGGLIIAMDQRHAERISKLVHQITGESPRLAISDIPDASGEIDRFANAKSCWIVAVKMISEGVDIPRLRVLVYATNITSVLFFRQAVGRVVRMINGLEEQSALFYMPAEEILLNYAHSIKVDVDHYIEGEDDPAQEPREPRSESAGLDSFYEAIASEAIPDDVIVDHLAITQEELDRARAYIREKGYKERGFNVPPEIMAQILRDFLGDAIKTTPSIISVEDAAPTYKRIEKLRKQVANLCNKYALMTNLHYRDVHTMWMKQGGMAHSKATELDLAKKKEWILRKIREYEEKR